LLKHLIFCATIFLTFQAQSFQTGCQCFHSRSTFPIVSVLPSSKRSAISLTHFFISLLYIKPLVSEGSESNPGCQDYDHPDSQLDCSSEHCFITIQVKSLFWDMRKFQLFSLDFLFYALNQQTKIRSRDKKSCDKSQVQTFFLSLKHKSLPSLNWLSHISF